MTGYTCNRNVLVSYLDKTEHFWGKVSKNKSLHEEPKDWTMFLDFLFLLKKSRKLSS